MFPVVYGNSKLPALRRQVMRMPLQYKYIGFFLRDRLKRKFIHDLTYPHIPGSGRGHGAGRR